MKVITFVDGDGHIVVFQIPEDNKKAKNKLKSIFKYLNYELYDELVEAIDNLDYDFIDQDLEDAGIPKYGNNIITDTKEITEKILRRYYEQLVQKI